MDGPPRVSEGAAAESAEDRFATSGTTAALMLADRSAAVEAARDATYPDLGTTRLASGRRQLSGEGSRGESGGAEPDDLDHMAVTCGPDQNGVFFHHSAVQRCSAVLAWLTT